MQDKFGGRIMKEFVALRPKMYIHLTDDGYVDKKAKDIKKGVKKHKIKLKNYKTCQENNETILNLQ